LNSTRIPRGAGRGVLIGGATVLIGLLAIGVLAGSLRYGGPDGLWLRARAELAAHRPHPQFVPTPFFDDIPALVASAGASDAIPVDGAAPLSALPTGRPIVTLAPSPSAVANRLAALAGPGPALAASPALAPALCFGGVVSTTVEPSPGLAGDPSAQPTPALAPAFSPTPAALPAAPQVQLTGLTHVWQTWNNCGPATLSTALSYYGSKLSQADIAAVMRPNVDDKNVNPSEMVEFARSHGFLALARVNGDAGRLRSLLSNGIPVLIETWLEPKPDDGMGHYRLLTGYDDARREWTVYDAYVSTGVQANQPYAGIRMPYDELDNLWSVFNRTYIIVYTPAQTAAVLSILGPDANDDAMWQRALQRHQAEAQRTPSDAFVRFDLGSDLVALGRFAEAAAAFDQARLAGLPWRMLWYQFGPFEAYYGTGRYQEIIRLADVTLHSAGDDIEELFYWRGMALNASGDPGGARQAWQQALKLNPHYADPAAALARLGP
jgi:tetratricopeptide (TPR) repeat protein